jgi:hypothetical protein
MEIFRYQSTHNPVYSSYLKLLGKDASSFNSPEEIPFLPIGFFREHKVVTGRVELARTEPARVFESSGSTSDRASRHYVSDIRLYRDSFTRGFELFYGSPKNYCILALLPSYLERQNSSLVFMANHLIQLSGHTAGGFYLDNLDDLVAQLKTLEGQGHRTLLLGVSFALLELSERHPMKLNHTIVMETGGMKGRRKEITREELHTLLSDRLGVDSVHSEYGMTELLSQAYSKGGGIFHCPPWMQIRIRDPYDPLSPVSRNGSGGINIIDLANLHSCSFIATQDIGKLAPGGGFNVLGRFDNSDVRGCNLLVE